MNRQVFRQLFLSNFLVLQLVIMALPLLLTGWYGYRVFERTNLVSLGEAAKQQAVRAADLLEEWLAHQPGKEQLLSKPPQGLKEFLAQSNPRHWVTLFGPEGEILASTDEVLPARQLVGLVINRGFLAQSSRHKQGYLLAANGQVAGFFHLGVPGRPDQMAYLLAVNKEAQYNQDLAELEVFFLVMVFLGGLLAGLAWLHYYLRIQKPLRQLVEADKRLTLNLAQEHSYLESIPWADPHINLILQARKRLLERFFTTLEQSEQVVEILSDGLFIFDQDYRLHRINRAAALLMEEEPEELLGRPFAQIVLGFPETEVQLCLLRGMNPEGGREAKLVNLDGKELPVQCNLSRVLLPENHKQGLLLVVHDLTRRKEQEAQILTFSGVAEKSPLSILITDPEGNVEYVNPYTTKKTGYSKQELLGQNPRIFKSGKMSPSIYQNLWRTLKSGGTWRGELLNRKKDGEEFWELANISSVLDQDGRVAHFLAVKEDITNRKKMEEQLRSAKQDLELRVQLRVAELREANARLEQAFEELKGLDRMKDDFLATVSHELKTPLASILGYAETLLDCEMDVTTQRRFHNIIVEESVRLSGLIENLLDMSLLASGKHQFNLEEVSLDAQVQRAIQAVEGLIIERGHIRIQAEPTGVNLVADPDRITQVLVNLLGNALKFSPDDGVIKIGVQRREASFILSVQDQGPGVPPEELENIFQKFKQIKRKDSQIKGTGLGLTISQRIIEGHKGRIWAENNEEGACFRFQLPYTQTLVDLKEG